MFHTATQGGRFQCLQFKKAFKVNCFFWQRPQSLWVQDVKYMCGSTDIAICCVSIILALAVESCVALHAALNHSAIPQIPYGLLRITESTHLLALL